MNQVMYSKLVVSVGQHTNIDIGLSSFRRMVVAEIRHLNAKFSPEYGQLIIVSDSRNYWRKHYFPHYKASRKKARDKSELDWPTLFKHMDQVKNELRDSFPYKYMNVEGAEADDIIATLCSVVSVTQPLEKSLIISGDKDFFQLHSDVVEQYDPVHEKFFKVESKEQALFEHILKGDRGDGIPNVASPDNSLVLGIRQKPMTQKLLASLSNIANEPDSPYYRNYIRNKTLIDLSLIPSDIKATIVDEFNTTLKVDRFKLKVYLASHKLSEHLESISDFF